MDPSGTDMDGVNAMNQGTKRLKVTPPADASASASALAHDHDHDGGSTMHSHSSPADDDSDLFPDEQPATPHHSRQPASDISPPTSLHAANAPAAPSSHTVAQPDQSRLNQNGKRALAMANSKATASAGKPNGAAFTPQVHQPSGYRWEREEDAPGYAWMNKKAQEGLKQGWDAIVDKDKMIRSEIYPPALLPAINLAADCLAPQGAMATCLLRRAAMSPPGLESQS